MKNSIDIFQCPVCYGELAIEDEYVICVENKHRFDIVDDIPLMFVEGSDGEYSDRITQKVKLFYEENPFPNYDESDNPGLLIAKAESSVFAKLLNDELPFNIRILEVGCGTGQMTNYLSLAHRYVFGVDLSLNSLLSANNFKKRNSLKRSSFYQMNLFKPVFKVESFHAVICNGVLHHTHEAYAGLRVITKLIKKGGYIILGLYNRYGRLFTNIRRTIFSMTGSRLHFLDAYLRRQDITYSKKKTWYLDQYENPYETTHTFGEVLGWFEQTGIEFISSIPEIGNILPLSDDYKLFSKKSRGNIITRLISQLAMPFLTNKEGGFFIMIGRKK
ncbi:MAG: class I SAM-dependent methyltransferase [Bacteroidetes bacterium]|nr:class I SAM-dependent methyltransferase [Bacteroidota bacterium]